MNRRQKISFLVLEARAYDVEEEKEKERREEEKKKKEERKKRRRRKQVWILVWNLHV